ncbi:uncharacterized protein LOC121602814 isoform X2 [Anopheles merus]|uniref:uncharacterized protein LOC121602814 isoform X2 n=1 Tax=Anopheles merus TaxID=30066 RepID=UPI001BE41A96|nr:uncharacterized protein LOC121602814 isoform X2 [Anopheles merus]
MPWSWYVDAAFPAACVFGGAYYLTTRYRHSPKQPIPTSSSPQSVTQIEAPAVEVVGAHSPSRLGFSKPGSRCTILLMFRWPILFGHRY